MSESLVVGLSLRAYARHRESLGLPGGTLRAVQKAIERGAISKLPDGKIDAADADRRWDAGTNPDALIRRDVIIASAAGEEMNQGGVETPTAVAETKVAVADTIPVQAPVQPQQQPGQDAPSPTAELTKWRASEAQIKVERARLERDQLAGRLLLADDVRSEQTAMAATVRTFLLGFVNDYSSELATLLETDERKTWIALDRTMKKALTKVSNELEEAAA